MFIRAFSADIVRENISDVSQYFIKNTKILFSKNISFTL